MPLQLPCSSFLLSFSSSLWWTGFLGKLGKSYPTVPLMLQKLVVLLDYGSCSVCVCVGVFCFVIPLKKVDLFCMQKFLFKYKRLDYKSASCAYQVVYSFHCGVNPQGYQSSNHKVASIYVIGLVLWNGWPQEVWEAFSASIFRKACHSILIQRSFDSKVIYFPGTSVLQTSGNWAGGGGAFERRVVRQGDPIQMGARLALYLWLALLQPFSSLRLALGRMIACQIHSHDQVLCLQTRPSAEANTVEVAWDVGSSGGNVLISGGSFSFNSSSSMLLQHQQLLFLSQWHRPQDRAVQWQGHWLDLGQVCRWLSAT